MAWRSSTLTGGHASDQTFPTVALGFSATAALRLYGRSAWMLPRRLEDHSSGLPFFSSAEQRYAPVEGEALAVAWGLEQTRFFTQGCNDLLVVTDHKPLVKILGDRTLDEIQNTRLFRLKQRTLPWHFMISHLPGNTNLAADATSRHPSSGDQMNIMVEEAGDVNFTELVTPLSSL